MSLHYERICIVGDISPIFSHSLLLLYIYLPEVDLLLLIVLSII